MTASRWEEEQGGVGIGDVRQFHGFSWLWQWRTSPTYVIAGVYELYEQLLPTRVYHRKKTRTGPDQIMCRLCGKAAETVAHILAGCSALSQSKYLQRYNALLKIIFFDMLHSLDLVESVPSWYSPNEPKSVYQNGQAQAVWDVPVYADHVTVRANRVDARIVDSTAKSATLLEMNCPWLNNKETQSCKKTEKYAPLRLELKRQFPGYQAKQFNIIMDVLGGYSKELESTIRSLVGVLRGREVLLKMQKGVLSQSLNIARYFKVLT